MNTWISTKNKLPDDEMCVLIVLEDREVWTGYIDAGQWRYASADLISEEVTHWMEFPAPPGMQS